MNVRILPEGIKVDNLKKGEALRDIIKRLGLFENEVLCIDNKTGRICFLNDKVDEDTDWTIKIVVSQG